MRIIGITGLIGSGKSLVEKIIIDNFDYLVIDADKIVNKEVFKLEEFLKFISSHGIEVDFSKNSFNKPQLVNKVFNDNDFNRVYTSFVWPLVDEIIQIKIKKITNEKIIFVSAAFLEKIKLDYELIININSNYKLIYKRVIKRGNYSKGQIENIIDFQKENNILTFKTININNNSNKQDLEKNIINIINKKVNNI